MGDVKHTKDILIACLPAPEREKKRKNEKANVAPSINQLKTSDSDSFLELVTKEEEDLQLARIESVQPMPNLLSKRPQIGKNIINMSGEDSKESRLMVMGGVSGLLELMKKDKVAPDIKTFDQLLRLIPNTAENELELLDMMEVFNVKPDVSFFNQVKTRNTM